MVETVIVRRGTFLDSVALMQVSRDAASLDGVQDASIVNATPLNVELVERQGFAIATDDALGPDDLLIAIRARGEEELERAVASIEERLRQRRDGDASGGPREAARSLTAAARRHRELGLALISVPGRFAAYECARALDAGLDVFCFSTGPGAEIEASLKAHADERGLLLMGPDCGTAILNGIAIGFGNACRPGPIGVAGASGTGIQAIVCRLDAAGVGISQAIGTGGRDLHRRIDGLMTRRAIELLGADPSTETIVVVGKAPDPDVASRVAAAAAATGKRSILAFPGLDAVAASELDTGFESSLEDAAAAAAGSVGAQLPPPVRNGAVETTGGVIRGLFSGGTLRDEAMTIIAGGAGRVATELEAGGGSGHVLIDLGDERFTAGRPHPMIDLSLRLGLLDEQSRDPAVGVLLLDLVLGYGAHPDPAAELAPAISKAVNRRPGALTVVVSLCGTDGDPQSAADQAQRLHDAGAVVTRGNADAAGLALAAAGLAGPGS